MTKPKFTNEHILTYVTDEQGKINSDIVCPIGCGRCCEYWRGVKHLFELTKLDKKRCPFLKSYGCRLERRKRPVECKTYICELALLAIERLISQKDIEYAIFKKLQDVAFTFFNRYPKIHKTQN